MSNTVTQCTELLHFLKLKGTITPMEALDQLGIYRLAARISDLRKEYNINTIMVSDVNKEGKDRTPLMQACEIENLLIVKLLLHEGADINKQSK